MNKAIAFGGVLAHSWRMMDVLFTQNLALPMVGAAVMGGYLSGSVPYGLLLGQIFGVGDLRKSGSGNIGATNMLRVGGKKLAAFTLLLDALKGLIPVAVAARFGFDYAVITAVAAVVGHMFPVWLKFKGGKGVATTLGVLFGLSLPLGVATCVMWLGVAFATRYSSLAALVAVALTPLYAWVFTGSMLAVWAVLLIALLVFIRHHENITRLINGTESKIGSGRNKTNDSA